MLPLIILIIVALFSAAIPNHGQLLVHANIADNCGLYSLNRVITLAQAIDVELHCIEDQSADNMTLSICRDVVGRSLHQLQSVHHFMHYSIKLTVDQAFSAKMAFSLAGTYLKTCRQTLEESGESAEGPFRNAIVLLAILEGDLCPSARAIYQQIRRMTADGGSPIIPGRSAQNHPIFAAKAGSLIDTIPAWRRIVVAKDGSGNCSSITEAIEKIPTNQSEYFLVSISEGMFEENLVLTADRPYVMMAGAGEGRTMITGNHSNGTGWKTYNSATLVIEAQYFIGYNLTIENTAGPQNFQAVALRVSEKFSVFYRCTILGFQDTFYVHHGLQFFRECTIAGTIDFIFGDLAVVLQDCNIIIREPKLGQSNTITASGRDCETHISGISIHRCKVIADPGLKNTTKIYLGRPWGKFARTAFMLSDLDVNIDPLGWLPFNPDPNDVDYGEFQNSGWGADTINRVNWSGYHKMDQAGAYQFTVDRLLNNGTWIDNTSVPYTKGLF